MEPTAREQTQHISGHDLILSSRVVGTRVYNREGDHLGHIDDLSIEKVGGQTIYAIMSFGGFLGIGERFHPVPWSLLDYDVEKGGFVIPLDKSALDGAPHYEAAEIAELGGPKHLAYGDSIYGYYGAYGAVPYW
ncbi:PRC-barrel domain-containing protein [Croceibacterium aestuarii]|uniref:PRC-barrel domain-containing protein n=1 Tax=Croceibacterium aestuarii TaxID=3064139 RepID=UPI00272DFCA1|nr:PRC-barrel domain-containing protein [Croceibacterium sp. D39]